MTPRASTRAPRPPLSWVVLASALAVSPLSAKGSIAEITEPAPVTSDALTPLTLDPPRDGVDPLRRPLDPMPFAHRDVGQEPASATILLTQLGEPEHGVTSHGIVSDSYAAPTWSTDPAPAPATRSFGSMFVKAWIPVTAAEFALLGVTAALPKDWTGWSANFVQDGINHLERAYTEPPIWDTDWWFHNYVGHPYGGSLYYNTVRAQGASPRQSFLMSAVLSTQWEYLFEAFAEQPSIQDLFVTPIAGSILGELSHRLTLQLKKGGTTTGEKILILLTNPMHAAFAGL